MSSNKLSWRKSINVLYCTNCREKGHRYTDCRQEKVSYGIILLKKFGDANKVLLISRKNSIGFCDFLRGKYDPLNPLHVKYLISQMLPEEIQMIRENINDFNSLWKKFWGNTINMRKFTRSYHYYQEFLPARDKFITLSITTVKDKIDEGKEIFTKIFEKEDTQSNSTLNRSDYSMSILEYLLNTTKLLFKSHEYGFPKGRKKKNESDIDCALREFEEETRIKKAKIKVVDNEPIVELCPGTDGVTYKHIYYISTIEEDVDLETENLEGEIGSIGFYSQEECERLINNNSIREYHKDKIRILREMFSHVSPSILIV